MSSLSPIPIPSIFPGLPGPRKLHTPLTLQLSKSIEGEYRAGIDESWRGWSRRCCESKGYGYMLYFIVLYVHFVTALWLNQSVSV